jgi:hypothetical protein
MVSTLDDTLKSAVRCTILKLATTAMADHNL